MRTLNAAPAAPSSPAAVAPTRTVICSDAIAWLQSLPDDGGTASSSQPCNSDAAATPACNTTSALDAHTHVFTSLPDISELPSQLVGGGSMPGKQRAHLYGSWFVEAATLLMRKMAPGTYCIFLQSDARMTDRVVSNGAIRGAAAGEAVSGQDGQDSGLRGGDIEAAAGGSVGEAGAGASQDGHSEHGSAESGVAFAAAGDTGASRRSEPGANSATSSTPTSKDHVVMWLDKSHLCHKAAEATGCTLVWHKVVLTSPLDKRCYGRPSYSHLLCFAKGTLSYPSQSYGTPDVFDRGDMLWARGIGLDCALLGVTFLKSVGAARRVVDPFCGVGTVLAMANTLGLDALGVELSPGRCKKAAGVDLYEAVMAMGAGRRSVLGLARGTPLQREFRVTVDGGKTSEKGDQERNGTQVETDAAEAGVVGSSARQGTAPSTEAPLAA